VISRITEIARSYYKIGNDTLYLIYAETFIQLINAAFFMVLLIQLNKVGYTDHASAELVSFRFLGVVISAIPLGIYVRNKPLLPFFYFSAVFVPLLTLAILIGIELHSDVIVKVSMFLWGVVFNFITVLVNPYIIRNCPKSYQSEAFTLSYATGSIGSIFCGILSFGILSIPRSNIGEREVMFVILLISIIGLFFLNKIKKEEILDLNKEGRLGYSYDWKIIFNALMPTFIIAIGAGFTIPFVNLFFFHVHHIDTKWISIISIGTSFLVFLLAMTVPNILKKYGYRKSISGTQSIAVALLILFATTEYYSNWPWAGFLAALFYIARQPLMNMTAPMTTELVMNYVGPRNKEIISALTSAIWSGSWFFSSLLFKYLREIDQPYVHIFLITGGLYILGVLWYYKLIVDYETKIKMPS
jgi:hypothetical protein